MSFSSFSSLPDGLDMGAISPEMLVRFPVGSLIKPAILWINDSWFIRSGVNMFDQATRDGVEAVLLSYYAVSSVQEVCASGSYGAKSLGADRYGGGRGTLHGGSGRCGAAGPFNAKGIGPTPLVPDNVDWSHSHGLLFLFEALREVIASELLSAEMPHGAVPVIAVIDAGYSYSGGSDSRPERCAILVRPNFLRIAHFERSTLFGTSGFKGSDQYRDASRVRDVVKFAYKYSSSENASGFDIQNLFDSISDQIGHSRAHRIWNGRCSTDNITVDGRFLDFGCFRSVPNWKSADDGQGQIFGSDAVEIENSAASLAHFFQKYANSEYCIPDPKSLLERAKFRIAAAFKAGAQKAAGFHNGEAPGAEFGDLMLRYYKIQQGSGYLLCEPSRSWNRRDWLYYNLNKFYDCDFSNGIYGKMTSHLNDLFHREARFFGSDPEQIYLSARRWLSPRLLQFYHVSKRRAQRIVSQLAGSMGDQRRAVGAYINSEIALGRRVWNNLDVGQIVLGYSADNISSVLFLHDAIRRENVATLRGFVNKNDMVFFNQRIPLSGSNQSDSRKQIEISIKMSGHDLSGSQTVNFSGIEFTLPAARLKFKDALSAVEARFGRVAYAG